MNSHFRQTKPSIDRTDGFHTISQANGSIAGIWQIARGKNVQTTMKYLATSSTAQIDVLTMVEGPVKKPAATNGFFRNVIVIH
jgi:hypothetical protein